MAKKAAVRGNNKNELVEKKVYNPPAVQENSLALPDYLQDDQMEGVADLKRYVVPPRLKIVQAQSGEQYDLFGEGDVLLVPQMILVAKAGAPFHIIPIFQFTEFCVWNPWIMKSQLPVIRKRTTDPTSDIAMRARNQDHWFDICPEAPPQKQSDEKYKIRFCEHINFMCVLTGDHELAGNPFVISFHHSGFRDGQNLSGLIAMRRASIYAGQYECVTEERKNDIGSWMGLRLQNPSADSGVPPWVSADDLPVVKNMFNSWQEIFKRGDLRPEYEDDTEETVKDAKGKF